MTKDRPMHIRVTEKTYNEIVKEAEDLGVSYNCYINLAVNEYINNKRNFKTLISEISKNN